MKTIWKELLICALMGIVLPGAIMKINSEGLPPETGEAMAAEQEETLPPREPFTGNPELPVLFEDGTVRNMDLEEYLVGVVLAEMPADFELEALKAQAVAARTYACKAHTGGGKHGDGSICTDSTCCQAYISENGYLNRGGSPLAVRKIRQAVEETMGQVLTHEGQLIEATYFSCSGGYTEDARAVWGADFPYLRSVESPGEENAEVYQQQVIVPREKAEMLLGLTLPENPAQWIGTVTHTPGKGVQTMELGGRIFKGTELRTLLNLRSTAFTASADDRGLILEVKGYGHRVGMSQYGADAMAATGKSYDEILSYYYQGTTLEPYRPPLEFTEDSQSDIA